MRVISMVPSWTETLIWAGVEVVGRTRFCIHPKDRVRSVPKVGGTKDWNLGKIQALKPDLLILDREENPLMMSQAGLPYWSSHVTSVESLPETLDELSQKLGSPRLARLGERWHSVREAKPLTLPYDRLTGVVEWGRRPERPVRSVVYVIWRDPWMAVAPHTFIGSVLGKLGMTVYPFEETYPQFEMESLPTDCLLLFSSEPYPFLRKREGLESLGLPYAFVDGECFSWFGIRALEFLETALGLGR